MDQYWEMINVSKPVLSVNRRSRRLAARVRVSVTSGEFRRHLAGAWDWLTRAVDLALPPLCVSCHQPLAVHHSLCAGCWSDISFISHPVCDRLGIPLPFDLGPGPVISAAASAKPPDFDRARVVAHFSGVMRDLIHKFKYGDQHTPRKLFNRWLEISTGGLATDYDVVVPVPLHNRRLLSRRFNQSAILAQDLAAGLDVSFEPRGLVRSKQTRSQVGLTRDQRRRNLQGAFAIAPDKQNFAFGRKVLLVDDVITTGTTVDACARAMRRAGAQVIDVVALAIVTDDSRIHP